MAVEVNPNRPANIDATSVASTRAAARGARDWPLRILVALVAVCLPLSLLILLVWYGAGLLLVQGFTLGLPREVLISLISTNTPLFVAIALFLIGLLSFFLARWRALHNPTFLDTLGCPSCGEDDLVRIRRQASDRVLSSLGLPLRRYACRNCTWEGRRLHSAVPSVLEEVGVAVEAPAEADAAAGSLSNGSGEWVPTAVSAFDTREAWTETEENQPRNGAANREWDEWNHRSAESAPADLSPAPVDETFAERPTEHTEAEPRPETTVPDGIGLANTTVPNEAVDEPAATGETGTHLEVAEAGAEVDELAASAAPQTETEALGEPEVGETLVTGEKPSEPLDAEPIIDRVDVGEQATILAPAPQQAEPSVAAQPVLPSATVVSPWGLSLYEEPSYESRVLTILKHSTSVDLLGGKEQREGVTWQEVEVGWQRGWVTDDFLEH